MKVFHPIEGLIEFIDATCGENAHPEGTRYRIAVGRETWEGQNPLVLKVQLVDKKVGVLGRRSPSFPLHSDDLIRVERSIQRQLDKAALMGMRVGCRAAKQLDARESFTAQA